MSIYESIQTQYDLLSNNKQLKNNKDAHTNKICIIGGVKIQNNIFNYRLNYNEDTTNIYNLIPLVNSLYTDYMLDFKYLKNQILFIDDKELLNQQTYTSNSSNNSNNSNYNNNNNIHRTHNKIFQKNTLLDFTIIDNRYNKSGEINNIQNVLIKYKNIKRIPTFMFNNLEVFNHVEFYYSFEWLLEEDITLIIKFNKSYFSIQLDIDLKKTKISKNKDTIMNNIIDIYESILNHINQVI